MPIRHATEADVPRIVALLQQRREAYQHYSPVFWKIADRAAERPESFIRRLVNDATVLTIVHESQDIVNGVLIANTMDAPPVYDPGGKVCMIDDYVVEHPELWQEVGTRLLESIAVTGRGLRDVSCRLLSAPKKTCRNPPC